MRAAGPAGPAGLAGLALSRPRLRYLDWSLLVWLAAAAVLGFLVLVPLAYLATTSLQQTDTGQLTLSNYVTAFSRQIYLEPILNSLKLATSVAVIAVAVGTPLAWLVTRTDLPGRALIRGMVLGAFVTPSFLGAIAWIFLAAPNSGWLNRGWETLTHSDQPLFDVFSLPGAIFVISLYSMPYAFSFVAGTLELMSSELEDAATTLGSSVWRTTIKITLPLALPAIVAGFIMSFLEALALFGAPAFLLIPARQQVVTTQLYLFFQFPTRVELAAAYAMPLLLVTVFLLWVQRRILGRRRFTTVTGKGGTRRAHRLGRWRWPALAFALIPPALSVVLPYTALLVTSLERAWGRGPFAQGNLGLYWYRWAIFDNPTTQAAIQHSLLYGAAAATIAVSLATLIAYVVVRRLVPGGQVLAFVTMAPFVVPGIVLAIGFFSAYTHPPLVLYGTGGILIAAFATRFLPIAYSNAASILQSINVDLENAARTLGAGRLHALLAVTAPLLRRGILSGWLLVFIPALRELSAAIFLFTPATAVMTTVIFDFSDAGNYEAVSTMGILMMGLTFLIVLVSYRVLGRDVRWQRAGGSAVPPPA
ncbi:MAG TPA: iron ABC transporter permease [Candidatus Acidoferrales bacterium]|nr:iron ABC transporter permease [Candidatus Acidoferrales bacterium]